MHPLCLSVLCLRTRPREPAREGRERRKEQLGRRRRAEAGRAEGGSRQELVSQGSAGEGDVSGGEQGSRRHGCAFEAERCSRAAMGSAPSSSTLCAVSTPRWPLPGSTAFPAPLPARPPLWAALSVSPPLPRLFAPLPPRVHLHPSTAPASARAIAPAPPSSCLPCRSGRRVRERERKRWMRRESDQSLSGAAALAVLSVRRVRLDGCGHCGDEDGGEHGGREHLVGSEGSGAQRHSGRGLQRRGEQRKRRGSEAGEEVSAAVVVPNSTHRPPVCVRSDLAGAPSLAYLLLQPSDLCASGGGGGERGEGDGMGGAGAPGKESGKVRAGQQSGRRAVQRRRWRAGRSAAARKDGGRSLLHGKGGGQRHSDGSGRRAGGGAEDCVAVQGDSGLRRRRGG